MLPRQYETLYIFILSLVLVSGFLFVTGNYTFRYEPVSQLVQSSDADGSAAWNTIGPVENINVVENGIELLRQNPGYTSAKSAYDLPLRTEGETLTLRVRADVNPIEDSRPDLALLPASSSDDGVFVVYWLSEKQDLLHVHVISRIDEGMRKKKIDALVLIPPEALYVDFGILLRHGGSSVAVSHLSLTANEPAIMYKVMLIFLALTMLILWLYLLYQMTHVTGWPVPIISSVMACSVLIGISLSSKRILGVLEPITSSLGLMSKADPEIVSYIYSGLHSLLFYVLTCFLLSTFSKYRKPWFLAITILFLIAVAIELLQNHIVDRSASFHDILMDTIGIILALIPALCIRMRVGKNQVSAH